MEAFRTGCAPEPLYSPAAAPGVLLNGTMTAPEPVVCAVGHMDRLAVSGAPHTFAHAYSPFPGSPSRRRSGGRLSCVVRGAELGAAMDELIALTWSPREGPVQTARVSP